MELWKFLVGYEGLYKISTLGHIMAMPKKRCQNAIILSQRLKKGYLHVRLSKEGKSRDLPMHRLIAMTFIPNPENKPCINHINGIKTDNRLENLEWVTIAENNAHARNNGLSIKVYPTKIPNYKGHIEKRVFQYDKSWNFIASFRSQKLAAMANGITSDTICAAIDKPLRSAGGYYWKSYADERLHSIEDIWGRVSAGNLA